MICSSPIIEFVIKLLHDIIKNVELNNPYTNNKETSPHPYYPLLSLPMHIYWDVPKWDALLGQFLGGTTGIRSIHPSLICLCLIFTLSFKKVRFAVQIPRKLDICMKTNIILSGKPTLYFPY